MLYKSRGIYLHSPTALGLLSSSGDEFVKMLADQAGVFLKQITRIENNQKLCYGFYTGKRAIKGEWWFFSHPSARRPSLVKDFDFGMPIVGRIVVFKWFSYQHYPDYQSELKFHLTVAQQDEIPKTILIDVAPPTSNPVAIPVNDGISGGFSGSYRIVEKPIEEILPLYQKPSQLDINAFETENQMARQWPIKIIDFTQPQEVVSSVQYLVEYFESQQAGYR
jgi:hypothetical protein